MTSITMLLISKPVCDSIVDHRVHAIVHSCLLMLLPGYSLSAAQIMFTDSFYRYTFSVLLLLFLIIPSFLTLHTHTCPCSAGCIITCTTICSAALLLYLLLWQCCENQYPWIPKKSGNVAKLPVDCFGWALTAVTQFSGR